MTRRVVVSGIGLITPCGTGVDRTWSTLVEGRSGVRPVPELEDAGLATRFAGRVVDFEPADFMDRKQIRRLDRFQQFAVAAAEMAVRDAALSVPPPAAERAAVIVGSGIGGMVLAEREYARALEEGPGVISPFFILNLLPNMAPAQIAIRHGFKGLNLSTNSACATSAHALGEAMRLIERDEADLVLAGGAEAPIGFMAIGGFNALRALSTRNDDPQGASRPFDRTRDGFVLAEGAAILLLEERGHALERGARIRAELVGYGTSADAHHLTAPAPEHEGGQRCMELALRDAGVEAAEVGYINAHATATPIGDGMEAGAIRAVFGEHADRIPVSSTKSMTGHMTGAAGAAEAAFAILAMERGTIPPTINLHDPDPEIDLDCVPNEARPAEPAVVMSNSFGFGGTNVSLVFRRPDPG
ncbi:MAG: beta-ketoacyl-ACP synthase II [Gemmatimonadetes bacterium]|nr:beta-ketoacyl-ACP synthase II [Gemmatimonadota bacterium]NIR77293.1 beta-ketoacyl-ACP synthase II [Gemmatimonadota bacterium]NIT85811.1 beta-ketoacyl-ACP synthase II [Gemmatimonadota bacterium]NIU29637.1 beta-ketoacyl-ACP synthase II [Gemmatimonadota bacterium]NIU34684.1 beta-ketoacyl-ACP synthase II [Gemmatimonadota bacterium]